jgi:hypothetical protein
VAIVTWFTVAFLALNTEPYGVFGLYLLVIVVAAVMIVRRRPGAR